MGNFFNAKGNNGFIRGESSQTNCSRDTHIHQPNNNLNEPIPEFPRNEDEEIPNAPKFEVEPPIKGLVDLEDRNSANDVAGEEPALITNYHVRTWDWTLDFESDIEMWEPVVPEP